VAVEPLAAASLARVEVDIPTRQLRENAGDAGATREYSLKNRYNENLWDILKGLEREGKITTTAVPDFFHHKT
jgi:hypothetical protein